MSSKLCPLSGFGSCKRNECAWWIDNTDGVCSIKHLAVATYVNMISMSSSSESLETMMKSFGIKLQEFKEGDDVN
jgi:hypothetical protein